jgi:hypothetical protein
MENAMRTVIVALPVHDDADIFDISDQIDRAMADAGIRDHDDDRYDSCVFEDVHALMRDLSIKIPKRMNAGRKARVTEEHNAPVVGMQDRGQWVRLNEGDEVVIDHWQKAFHQYACKVPTGQTVWIDSDLLTVD